MELLDQRVDSVDSLDQGESPDEEKAHNRLEVAKDKFHDLVSSWNGRIRAKHFEMRKNSIDSRDTGPNEVKAMINEDLVGSGDEEVRIEQAERSRSRESKRKRAPAFLRISADF